MVLVTNSSYFVELSLFDCSRIQWQEAFEAYERTFDTARPCSFDQFDNTWSPVDMVPIKHDLRIVWKNRGPKMGMLVYLFSNSPLLEF